MFSLMNVSSTQKGGRNHDQPPSREIGCGGDIEFEASLHHQQRDSKANDRTHTNHFLPIQSSNQ